MPVGPTGKHRWARSAVVLSMSVVAASCGGGDESTAVGADVTRPATPSMALVRYEDVAAEVGLDFEHGAFHWGAEPDPAAMMGGGLCWVDYDRDGWLDLYVTNTWSTSEWGRWRQQGALPQSRLFRNEDGMFVDVTERTGAGLETRANGCVAADLDLDGWSDLYVTTERENVLLWNDGGEGFVPDADASGVDEFGWHSGAAVGDVDGNGWPDLFVAGYVDLNRPIAGVAEGFPNPFEPEPDLLFLNDGPPVDGSAGARVAFREVAGEAGIEPAGPDYGLGALLTDFDLDGDLDLYVANDTTPNQLYENQTATDGPGVRFDEVGVDAGVGDRGAGMGVAAADADGDELADLVVTNQLDERSGAWWNRTGAPGSEPGLRFVDARPAMGLAELGTGSTGWGSTWSDVDLDTDLDLVVVNGAIPVRDLDDDAELMALYENRLADGEPGAFADASATVGLVETGPFLARGLAAADYDNDGDVDLAVGTIGGRVVLLRNSGAGGNWLEVATPTPAPGAVVTVVAADGARQQRRIAVGGSYLSSEDPRAHFGLGTADRVTTVRVEWPDGSATERSDVEANQILEVEPG